MLTGFLQEPFFGGLGAPAPMPLHGVAHLLDQHVSMPAPIVAPFGYFASHAEIRSRCSTTPCRWFRWFRWFRRQQKAIRGHADQGTDTVWTFNFTLPVESVGLAAL